MGMRFSAPSIKGQAPSACEQVIMATKSDFGLKSLVNTLEKPIIGWALSAYFILYMGLFPSDNVLIVKPEFCKVVATIGNNAVASVPLE